MCVKREPAYGNHEGTKKKTDDASENASGNASGAVGHCAAVVFELVARRVPVNRTGHVANEMGGAAGVSARQWDNADHSRARARAPA